MGQNHREASASEYHVLAVDDSPVDRKIIERLLGNSSYKVTSVDCVRKALEFLGLEDDCEGLNVDKIKVNMIVTDYNMPGLTGYDLLRRVKESSTLKDIPVVIMSSENEESRTRRYMSGGAEEFILKPVRSSDVERLRSHILKRQPSSSSNKRKYMSDSILVQAERRPRLSGLTVA